MNLICKNWLSKQYTHNIHFFYNFVQEAFPKMRFDSCVFLEKSLQLRAMGRGLSDYEYWKVIWYWFKNAINIY